MTSGSPDEARELGKMLLEKNLAACVNVLEVMYSLYRWEGEIQEDQETVLIVKTRHELVWGRRFWGQKSVIPVKIAES